MLCSVPGSVQSFSVSVRRCCQIAHCGNDEEGCSLSAPGPVGSVADNELFTVAHAEKPLKTAAWKREGGERGDGVGGGSHQC